MKNIIRTALEWLIGLLDDQPQQSQTTSQQKPQQHTRIDVFGVGDLIEVMLFWGLPATALLLIVVSVFGDGLLDGYGIPIAVLLFVYWFLGFVQVDTTERAVKLLFKRPYTTCESGLRWIPFLIGSLARRTTNIVTLDFEDSAGVFTRQGKALGGDGQPIENGRVYGSINVGLHVAVLFQWPDDDMLIDAVVKLPNTLDDIKDLLEEPVLDRVRTTGGDYVWINLVQRRAHFAKQVRKELLEDEDGVVGSILKDTGLERHFQIAIKHVDVPQDVKDSLSKQEKAELDRAGKLIDADAERQKLIIEGEGTAKAKQQLLAVLRRHPENLQAQALLTLIEMAQGEATTIFPLSTDLTNVLGRVLRREDSGVDQGVDSALRALTPQQRAALAGVLQSVLNPGGNQ